MKPRNTRVLVFATALLTAPVLPAWSQAPVHPRPPQQNGPQKPPEVVIKETPIEQEDPQPQGTPQDQGAAQGQQGQSQDPAATPEQGTAQPDAQAAPPGQAEKKVVKPEEIGISFAPPQGWQQGDPTKAAVNGDPCCVWSPDNVASIVAFVQRPGKPLNPKVLLDASAKALQSAFGAEVKTQEVKDIGGLRGFSLVVTAPGNGGSIDGKGTVPTTQHWIGIPREQDVIVFLMTTPEASFAQNEQVFQGMLSSLKVTGTQTPGQQASK